ncbi:sugar phosphate isomerase/epimerase family protein [Alsobacter sp. R-9]
MTRPIDGLSFQLYSARSLEGLERQFELLAGIGYRKVEPFGGLFGDPAALKALIARHGMTAPTAHVGLDRMRADAAATFRMCRDIGIETVYAPAPPMGERDGGEKEWRAIGAELAKFGKVAREEGLGFGWHNHHWEYGKAADGRLFLDVMFNEAPDILWEADLAWIVRGGADPVSEVKRYAGRVKAVHIKDIAPAGQCLDEDGWADVGHGTLDWGTIVPALKAVGVTLFVAEHDKPNDVARFARRAYDAVAAWA